LISANSTISPTPLGPTNRAHSAPISPTTSLPVPFYSTSDRAAPGSERPCQKVMSTAWEAEYAFSIPASLTPQILRAPPPHLNAEDLYGGAILA